MDYKPWFKNIVQYFANNNESSIDSIYAGSFIVKNIIMKQISCFQNDTLETTQTLFFFK